MSPSFIARALRSMPLGWRLACFAALERYSDWRHPPPDGPAPLPVTPERASRPALWLFASTIGEVNAIEPFTRQLLAEMGEPPLVLLTDRSTYADSYRAKYPQARVVETGGRSTPVIQALVDSPPGLLVVAEIPCLLHDAPCRLPFAALVAARRAGAKLALVNGWLYGYRPASGLDRLEKLLFDQDYVRLFDLLVVQTPEVELALRDAGADAARVHVAGNIKFDAWFDMAKAQQTPLARALAARAAGGRVAGPVIVAGSVTETRDHEALLGAFSQVLREHSGALLVLAPRHPENAPRMQALAGLLESSGLAWRRRSGHEPPAAVQTQVLVLDTMGELQGCYAAASLAFVGRDHNVLEPLAFDKPVFVGPGWEPTYPSYPVYRQLMSAGALNEVPDLADLGHAWCRALAGTQGSVPYSSAALLRQAGGAAARSLAALRASGLTRPRA